MSSNLTSQKQPVIKKAQNASFALGLFSRLINGLWSIMAISLIVLAIIIAGLRLFAGEFSQFKPQLESYLSKQLARDVHIKALKFDWLSVGPKIQIQQLEIADSKNVKLQSLKIANGVVLIDLWRSFFQFELITDEIKLQGIQIQYNPSYRNKDHHNKQTSAALFEQNKTPVNASSKGIVNWLMQQRTIEIYDSALILKTRTGKDYSLALPVLTYHGGINLHQLNGIAMTVNGKKLTIKSELIGRNTDPDRKLQLYIKADDIELKDLPTALFFKKYTKIQGSIAIEIWSDFKASRMQKMLIKASANKLLAGEKKLTFSIPESFFLWKRNHNKSWNFISTPIAISLNNKKLPSFTVKGNRLEKNSTNDKIWNVEGLSLPVNLISGIIQDQLPKKFKSWLDRAKPHGVLNNIGATIAFNKKQTRFNLYFDLHKFHITQVDKYPGFKNISGHVAISNNSNIITLNSKNGVLNLSPLFRFPLPFNKLTATLKIINQQGLKIIWDNFKFKSDNINIDSIGKLEYQKDGKGYLEISSNLYKGNAKFTSHFLPVGIMSKNAVKYLDESIISGELLTAKAIARGSFKEFPYVNGNGIFDVQATVADIRFKFLPHWPQLNKLKASLRFHGDSMLIEASAGEIEGINLDSATAEIPALSKIDNNLLLNIKATTNGKSALGMLSKTTLKNISKQLDFLQFSNNKGPDLTTKLFLDIPLNGKTAAKVRGDISFVDSRIAIKQPYIPLQKIYGKILISENGLTRGDLRGQMWGQPFKLDLYNKNPATGIITATFKSKISTFGINALSNLNFNNYIKGTAEINGQIKIEPASNNKSKHTQINIQSNLNNLSLSFPDHLLKESPKKWPLNFSLDIFEKDLKITSQLGKSISFSATKNTSPKQGNNQDWHGFLKITDGKTTQQKIKQANLKNTNWLVDLSLNRLNLDDWLPVIKNIFSRAKSAKNATNSMALTLAKLPKFDISLKTNNFSIFNFNFNKIRFNVSHNKALQLKFTGAQATGDITLDPQATHPVEVNFDTLKLTSDDKRLITKNNLKQPSKEQNNHALNLSKKWQAADFPHMKIYCKLCQYNEQLLGTITLETLPTSQWTAFHGKWFYNKIFNMDISGLWKGQNTEIQGKLIARDFNQFNKFWKFSSGVKKSNLKSTFSLKWPKSPWDFKLATVEGKVSTTLSKGYIEEISAKGAQVFSLFSLQNLKRRLTLDFSDVFEDGFFYDDITGTFLIKNGTAYSQGIKINGTAAGITITGSTDLVSGEFNQHMVVTPKLSSSLPVLAGWAINPPTALIALVLDKLFLKPALDVVSRIDYQISGPWNNPKLTELGKKQQEIQIESQNNVDEQKILKTDLQPQKPER